jgi:Skp family chaperone for outer membrane proteins
MLNRIFIYSKIAAVLCVIPLTIFFCLFLNSLRVAADAVATLPKKVDDRIDKIQTDVLNKIDTVQDKLDGQMSSITATVDKRIEKLATLSDSRLQAIQNDVTKDYSDTRKDLFAAVADTRKDLFSAVKDVRIDTNTQLVAANTSLSKLSTAYSDVPSIIGTRLDKFTDCEKNQLCLQGQLSDTLFATRAASREATTTMLTLNKSVPAITQNFASITTNINSITKPRWYDRLIGYGVNGALIYRSLNPATNLVVTGAQILSSQK